MSKVRATFSLDSDTNARIRQCGSRHRGGASGYIAELVRKDQMREAVAQLEQFHRANPSYAEDSEAELTAAQAEA
ncbi:hypothetical protein [Pseudonocardia sp. TRM90224]|uniref:hypothetical protein n=1 Tax=Pseudonocardia sp. TRM90224 TaxID=2812678 RepID=UPI001E29BBB5|nr:hypothetical protein [Pseudonocardia sp. TRM90224]